MHDYIELSKFRFGVTDYVVFTLATITSTGVGLYYGFFKDRRRLSEAADPNKKYAFGSPELSEYLLGSQNMKVFPVAMSLVASYISGVSVLGTPSEIYNYGTQYWLIIVAVMLMAVAVSQVYLPVFSTLRVESSYQYLEMRFNPLVRSIASVLFVMDEILFLPFIVFVPALALNQVTDINMFLIGAITCVVCLLYTLLGGIKAVVHTDLWQTLLMFLSVLIVVIIGTGLAGGPVEVFKSASEGGRLVFFNMSPSLYERLTFWSALIGGFSYWTSFNSVNQTMVQRYMSLPTLQKGKQAITVFTVGIVLFLSFCCFAGLLIYNFYQHCDPLTKKFISNDDQLLAIYVMTTARNWHGIPGLFIAGVFGAGISSLSVVLNCTGLVILEDITKGLLRLNPSQRQSTIIVKTSIIVLSIVAFSGLFQLQYLKGVLGVATAVTAIASSTTCGIFTLGMIFPWSNSKGATIGAIVGALLTAWMSIGAQIAAANGDVIHPKLPISIAHCSQNDTIIEPVLKDHSDVFFLYRLPYLWVNPFGILVTISVGLICSFITGPTELKDINVDLLSPVIYRFLPKEIFPSDHEMVTLKSSNK